MLSFSISWLAISFAFSSISGLTSTGENKNSTRFASGLNSHSTSGKVLISPFSFRATKTDNSFWKSIFSSITEGESNDCSASDKLEIIFTPFPS